MHLVKESTLADSLELDQISFSWTSCYLNSTRSPAVSSCLVASKQFSNFCSLLRISELYLFKSSTFSDESFGNSSENFKKLSLNFLNMTSSITDKDKHGINQKRTYNVCNMYKAKSTNEAIKIIEKN